MDVNAVIAAVETLERRLEEHLSYLRGAALACPPGGARPWDEALAHYQVQAEPAHVRVQSASDSQQRAGAIVPEFERALAALARFADDEVTRTFSLELLASVPPPVAHRVEMLRARLRSLPKIESERYANEVGAHAPKTVSASVSSVFANAQSTAKMTPWANVKFDASSVMTCRTCGAPQEKPLDFKCRYCRNNMYEKR